MPAKPAYPERSGIIPGMLGNSPYSSRAQQLQRTTGTPDTVLLDLARVGNPTVAWWWGIRKVDGRMCAWCYVCEKPIVFGGLSSGITEAQQYEVDVHRASHWEEARQALRTEGKQ